MADGHFRKNEKRDRRGWAPVPSLGSEVQTDGLVAGAGAALRAFAATAAATFTGTLGAIRAIGALGAGWAVDGVFTRRTALLEARAEGFAALFGADAAVAVGIEALKHLAMAGFELGADGLQLFVAELAVIVGIKAGQGHVAAEGWAFTTARAFTSTGTFATARAIATSGAFAARAAFAGFAFAAFAQLTSLFAKGAAGGFAFLFAELAVAVSIEAFEHAGPHGAIAFTPFTTRLAGVLGHGQTGDADCRGCDQ